MSILVAAYAMRTALHATLAITAFTTIEVVAHTDAAGVMKVNLVEKAAANVTQTKAAGSALTDTLDLEDLVTSATKDFGDGDFIEAFV